MATPAIDLFYNPTPGLRANLTINTDFAQTEVDQRQVNLTRFSLFFPERRDFFLDGATFFDFASNNIGGEQVQPYFSRRIGLSADATPQRIDYGTKFNGQVGAQDVGFLHVRTADDADSGFIGEEFTAARVKRRILTQSYIGGIYTRRDARVDGAAHTTPSASTAEPVHRPVPRRREPYVSAWYLRREPPGREQRDERFRRRRSNTPTIAGLSALNAREVQAELQSGGGLRGPSQLPPLQPVRQLRPQAPQQPRGAPVALHREPHLVTDLRNELVERNLGLTLLQMQFQSQENFSIEIDRNFDPPRGPIRHQLGHHAARRRPLTRSPGSPSAGRRPTAACWR